ncbi:MAG: CDP-alcohol phosphatidyltransferase family protein [Anaerolineales bacterium]|nr:CDP-alcohol phosphatidyltransferase family protein [Anaerolineales bacterium]
MDIKSHKRINDILLGPLERPALKWLAEHMPGWVSPDLMTGIGTLGAVLIFAAYAMTRFHPAFLWLASLGFVINWFGDSLDGTIARHRGIERPKYGYFVDHTVDSLNEVLIFLGLGMTPYVRFEIASLALIGYLLVSIMVYILTAVSGIFQISFGRFGPTEIRVIAILLNVGMFFTGDWIFLPFFGGMTLYDTAVLVIAIILFLIYIVTVVQKSREMAGTERQNME